MPRRMVRVRGLLVIWDIGGLFCMGQAKIDISGCVAILKSGFNTEENSECREQSEEIAPQAGRLNNSSGDLFLAGGPLRTEKIAEQFGAFVGQNSR